MEIIGGIRKLMPPTGRVIKSKKARALGVRGVKHRKREQVIKGDDEE